MKVGKKLLKPMSSGLFTDKGFKNMEMLYFDVKEKGGKITVTRATVDVGNGEVNGFRYPMKVLRTKKLTTRFSEPVFPLYRVLIDRGIIFPFQSTLTQKDWLTLPFEDMDNMEPQEI